MRHGPLGVVGIPPFDLGLTFCAPACAYANR